MSIGRFARATRLTVKALRHYDQIGLLRPASVDPRSGYRTYEPAQVRDAVLIATLRSLDVPLASVARVLRDRGLLEATLRDERARIEGEIAARRRALLALDRLARGVPLFVPEVGMRDEPARRVARMSVTTSAEALESDTTRAVRAIVDALRAAAITPRDPVMAIFGAPMDESTIPLEVAVTIQEGDTLAHDVITVGTVPAARCAWVRHVGPYPELALAHHALLSWADHTGAREHGALREIYVNDPDEVADAALVTDVLLPVD